MTTRLASRVAPWRCLTLVLSSPVRTTTPVVCASRCLSSTGLVRAQGPTATSPAPAGRTESDDGGVSHRSATSSSTPATSTAVTATAVKRFFVVRPDLVDDWVPEMNDVDVQSVLCSSPVPAWWRCALCHTRYQATVKERIAMEAACCPHCHGRGVDEEVIAADTPATDGSEARRRDGGAGTRLAAPLTETHPELTTLWDSDSNGALAPHHVTANSTTSVWWRTSMPSEPGRMVRFKRPVFAMVRDQVSPQVKRVAQARAEEALLQHIHDVAHVEAAEPSTRLPRASRLFATQYRPDSSVGLRTVSVVSSEATPATAGPAVTLWKQRVRAEQGARSSSADGVTAKAQDTPTATTTASDTTSSGLHTGRALFYHTTAQDTDVWRTGQRLRRALLDDYTSFVLARRRGAGLGSDLSDVPSVLAAAVAAEDRHDMSLKESWLNFFSLSESQAAAQSQPRDDATLILGFDRTWKRETAPQHAVRTRVAAQREEEAESTVRTSVTGRRVSGGGESDGGDVVLQNYPRLPRRQDRDASAATTNAAAGSSGAATRWQRSVLPQLPDRGVAITRAAVDHALEEAFREELSQLPSSSSSSFPSQSSSSLLSMAMAAEEAVARQRAAQYERRLSAPLTWTPETLLGEQLGSAKVATTAAGYPVAPAPRKVRRVRLQPPPELRGDDSTTAGRGAAVPPLRSSQSVLEMVREATPRRQGTATSAAADVLPPSQSSLASSMRGATAAQALPQPAAPVLTARKVPRKVARPARKVKGSEDA